MAREHVNGETISAYVDLELDTERAQAVRDHLGHCRLCSSLEAEIRSLGNAVRAEIVPSWDEEAMARVVRQKLDRPYGLGWHWASPTKLAAAAVIVAAVGLSALGIMGNVYRQDMKAQDELVIRSHYAVRSGEPGVILVSSPGVR